MQTGKTMVTELLTMDPEKLRAMQREALVNSISVEKGPKITVPENVPLDVAIATLQRQQEQEEKLVTVSEIIDTYPLDGAYCLAELIVEQFNVPALAEGQKMQTPLGEMEISRASLEPLKLADGSEVMVPWGNFRLPGIDAIITSQWRMKNDTPVFCLSAEVKGKHRGRIVEFANLLRKKVAESSIYRNKALKVAFRDEEGNMLDFHPTNAPGFLDLSSNERPIFNRDTQAQVDTSIFNHIRYIDKIKANGMKTRRTVLLEGTYGSGKTLLGLEIARQANAAGWTFINLQHCEDLERAIKLAVQLGNRTVIFAEDVDRAMGGERDQIMDQLSYAIDGIESKNRDLLIILTTNNISSIQKLMMRPGRIDSIISLGNPDSETQVKMLFHYGNGRVKGDATEFKSALKPVEGQSAAVIREIISKAELSAIARDGALELTPNDVNIAAQSMSTHIRLMSEAPEKTVTEEVKLTDLAVNIPKNAAKAALASAK